EEELERLHKRFPYPRFSKAEYQRRYRNIRTMMRELRLDCLLIIGGSAAYGRLWFNFRYVTNMMGKAEMANYCFFPKEGDPCVILRPGHSLAGAMLARTTVREIIVGDPSVLTARRAGWASSSTTPTPRFRRITGISLRPSCRRRSLSSSQRNSVRCAW